MTVSAPVYIANRFLSATRVALAADNANLLNYDKTSGNLIVVFQIDCERGPWNAQYKLQWKNVASGSYVDIAATGQIAWGSTTDLVQGTAVTTRACTTAGAAGSTWQNGEEVEGASTSDAINLADEYYTEIHFAIDPAAALYGNTYKFQLYDVTAGAARAEGTGNLSLASQIFYLDTNNIVLDLPSTAPGTIEIWQSECIGSLGCLG